jgi:aminoglycoside N3'-acetyltransferase
MNVKLFVPINQRTKIKRIKRKIVNFIRLRQDEKTCLLDLKNLFIYDFGLKKSDAIFVSASFGNLNANFSPNELITLFQRIIGEEGNIFMPFYPPGYSYEWADADQIFDMNTTRSSMGVLTQVFSEFPNVYKSKHPTKSVVAWGKDAKKIIEGHEHSYTPFYWNSPYGWLLKNKSKSLGLGVSNIPMFHAIEDTILPKDFYLYRKTKQTLRLIDYDNSLKTMEVFIHDPKKIGKLIPPGEFAQALNISSYRRRDFGFRFCYVVDNAQLYTACQKEFLRGNVRLKNPVVNCKN